jgi:hypothetical protein
MAAILLGYFSVMVTRMKSMLKVGWMVIATLTSPAISCVRVAVTSSS